MNIQTGALAKGVLALTLAACLQISQAQRYDSVNVREQGSGILHAYGHDFRPNEVKVVLSPGGDAEISTNHTTFFGSWRPDGNHADLTINRIHGRSDESDRASGSGYVTLGRNGDWTHVVINGRNETDRSRVTLDFTPFSQRRSGNIRVNHSRRTRGRRLGGY